MANFSFANIIANAKANASVQNATPAAPTTPSAPVANPTPTKVASPAPNKVASPAPVKTPTPVTPTKKEAAPSPEPKSAKGAQKKPKFEYTPKSAEEVKALLD